jgi:hypothetical protein
MMSGCQVIGGAKDITAAQSHFTLLLMASRIGLVPLLIKLSMSEAFSPSAICQSVSSPEDLPQFIYLLQTTFKPRKDS